MIAAGLLAGATPVFTGCIDNDEPEGISILRGAKAELLQAKAAVEAAKVAQIQAEAALIQAQAKYQEALATTEAANAKIKEAIAKQEEAKAALLETQNEQAKQELQAAIAELEHQKEMWEIEKTNALTAAEQAAKMWELSYKQAEIEYEKALVELESKKTTLTQQQLAILSSYINDVKSAKSALNKAQKDLKAAERAMQKAAAVVTETEADKEYWQYELAKTLKLEQYALEGVEAAKTTAEEELKEMQAAQPTELGKKLESIKAEVDALNLEILNATMAGAIEREAINEKFLALYQRRQQWYNNRDVTHVVPEFTYPEGLNNAALPLVWIDYGYRDLEFPEETYSLSNPSYMVSRIEILNNYLDIIKTWTRDANDDAWTSQRIAEWKKDIETLKANIETKKAAWKEAVDAYYRTPADAVIDLTKFTGYNEFAKALPNFNNATEENETAWVAIENARTAYDKAMTAYYDNINKLNNERNEAYTNLQNSQDEKIAEFTAEQEKLLEAYQKISEDFAAGVEGVTQEQVDAAWNAYTNANPWDKWNEYQATETSQIEANYYEGVKEEKTAWNEAANAYKAAIETYKTKRAALDTEANTITPLYAAFVNSATEAESNYCAILNVVDFMGLADMYNDWEDDRTIETKNVESTDVYETTSERIYYRHHNYETQKVEIENAAKVTISTLRELIAHQSNIIFGTNFGTNAYEDPDSRLLDMTYDDVKAAIEASSEEPLYGTAYINACGGFGLMGAVFATEARIEFAEAWIADENNSVNKLIAALSSAVETLETEYDGLVEASTAEWEAIQDEYRPLEIEYQNTYDEANFLREKYDYRLAFYQEQLYLFNSYINAGIEEWTTEMIEDEIEFLEARIRGLELEIEDQKHEVETAQRNLDGYNNGNLTALETATEAWEDAVTDVENANEDYKAALETLNAIIAKMSVEAETPETPAE